MKPLICCAAFLALAGCQPSNWFGAGGDDELLGGPSDRASRFSSGCWEGDDGRAWSVTLTGDSFAAIPGPGDLSRLSIRGKVTGDQLNFRIGRENEDTMATGSARWVDANHAVYSIESQESALGAHGLFHFNHAARSRGRAPVDVLPAAECPDTAR